MSCLSVLHHDCWSHGGWTALEVRPFWVEPLEDTISDDASFGVKIGERAMSFLFGV